MGKDGLRKGERMKKDNFLNFAKAMFQLREKKNMNLELFSKKLKISASSFSKMEGGYYKPNQNFLKSVEEVFGKEERETLERAFKLDEEEGRNGVK